MVSVLQQTPDTLVFSDGTYAQAPGRSIQKQPRSEGRRNRKVDQQIFFEQGVTDLRQVCENRYPKVLQSADGFTSVVFPMVEVRPRAKNISVRPDAS